MYELKFTRLQSEIFRLLCMNVGIKLNQREIARKLEVSPTAISKALVSLEKNDLAVVKKDKNINLNLVELNRDNAKAGWMKRAENLKIIYESGVVEFLEENFPGAVIIMFGSYSYGEDTFSSDIDIAIIGAKQKIIDLEKFEKILERKININFYSGFNEIHKNLRSNIFNGIVLAGRISL